MDSLIDEPDLDTWLAHALQASGRVTASDLAPILEEVGAANSKTLARVLLERGFPAAELNQALQAGASRATGWFAGGRIDSFRLVRRLGAGGMGEVWEATDEWTQGSRALKTLLPGSPPEDVLRFLREGEGQARADGHPNVARVHGTGEAAGRPYLVMSLLKGDLSQRLRHGPLGVAEAVELMASLAHGLAHVHAQGVLHRDLKPANVLFDQAGVPKLTDFGLAKLRGAESLTETGTLLGTPAYMAPEQISAASSVDPRADVYGLGAVLFHVLAGRPPFEAQSAIALMLEVTSQEAPSLRSLRREVPRRLSNLCARTLSKDPRLRPLTALALAEELEGCLHEEPTRGPRIASGLVLIGIGVTAIAGLAHALSQEGEPPSVSPPPSSVSSAGPSSTPLLTSEEKWVEQEWLRIASLRSERREVEANWRALRLAHEGDQRARLEVGTELLNRKGEYLRDRQLGRVFVLEAGLAGDRRALCFLAGDADGESGGRIGILAVSLLRVLEGQSETPEGQEFLASHAGLDLAKDQGAREAALAMIEGLASKMRSEREPLWSKHEDDPISVRFLAQRGDSSAMRKLAHDTMYDGNRDRRLALFLLHSAAQLGSEQAAAHLAQIYLESADLDVAERLELLVASTWGGPSERPKPNHRFGLNCLSMAQGTGAAAASRRVRWVVASARRAGWRLPPDPKPRVVEMSRQLGF